MRAMCVRYPFASVIVARREPLFNLSDRSTILGSFFSRFFYYALYRADLVQTKVSWGCPSSFENSPPAPP